MGELKDRMKMLMELKNFSQRTIECYLMYMRGYVKLNKKSPAEMGEEEVLKYLYYMRSQKKSSWSAVNIAYSALKFFYIEVMGRSWDLKKIPRPKVEKRLPEILSREEVKRLLESITNLKHRTILMATYSAGLRIREATRLKISDIDSQRMQIRISQGKGKKDRYSILSMKLLEELRGYYRIQKPKDWLFPGRDLNEPVHISSIQRAFRDAKKKRGYVST